MVVVLRRFPARARALAGRLALSVIFLLLPVPAGAAQMTTFDVSDRAIVSLEARQADIQIKTWDRSTVQVESDDDFAAEKGIYPGIPDVPVVQAQLHFGETTLILPPEDFPVLTVPRAMHDLVKIGTPQSAGTITVTIPASTAFIIVRAGGGRIRMNDYQNGTFFVQLRNGAIAMTNMGGDGFVQLLRGHLSVTDSNFSRLRARTAAANMVFENCRARQIETSSIAGSIVYDNGGFDGTLARFDSQDGNVAVGVSGSGQIGARTGDGHIFTSFGRNVSIESRPNETNVALGGPASPAINASSTRGNVFLYDGSLANKNGLSEDWQPMRQLYINRRRDLTTHAGPRVQPRVQPRAQPRPANPRRPPGALLRAIKIR